MRLPVKKLYLVFILYWHDSWPSAGENTLCWPEPADSIPYHLASHGFSKPGPDCTGREERFAATRVIAYAVLVIHLTMVFNFPPQHARWKEFDVLRRGRRWGVYPWFNISHWLLLLVRRYSGIMIWNWYHNSVWYSHRLCRFCKRDNLWFFEVLHDRQEKGHVEQGHARDDWSSNDDSWSHVCRIL